MSAFVMASQVALVSGDAHPVLAEDLARVLGLPLTAAEIGQFADGETRVRIPADVLAKTVVIVQPTSPPVNDHLVNLAFMIDAAHAAGAARVIAVVPYFGYARQEQRSAVGDSRSAQVACKLLGAVSLDHLITIDLHAPALESALPVPATLLRADELFIPTIRGWGLQDTVIVAPDAGGLKRAQRFALELQAPLAVIAKHRPQADQMSVVQLLGDVRGRTCVIVDDMSSTGRTLAAAAATLRGHGAAEIHAVFTHAVMAPGAFERLEEAPLSRLLTSDSVPLGRHPRIEIARTSPLLAESLRQVIGLASASQPTP